MTPTQAYRALETVLEMLERIMPGFYAVEDRADFIEARAALEEVRDRLAQDIAQAVLDMEVPT